MYPIYILNQERKYGFVKNFHFRYLVMRIWRNLITI